MAAPQSDVNLNLKLGGARSKDAVDRWQRANALEFTPNAEDLEFLRKAIHIEDVEELKAHVVQLRNRAIKVFPYPCIFKYSFAATRVTKIGGYKKTLQLAKERGGALMLDIGCCFGADVRMAVLDGFPPTQIVASDLHAEFWDLGHELFRDDKETMPVTFLAGDVFDPSFLSALPVGSSASTTPLSELTSLTPLHGRLSSIHASLFFHLFTRVQQEQLAAHLASLLLQEKGSVLFGHQIAAEEEGLGQHVGKWSHNVQSWTALWETALAGVGWKGGVGVQAKLTQGSEWVTKLGFGTHMLWWTVELL
ncbi:hypothetical protein CALVIDRAFT_539784 [Calocera viscosa TUFC12733]|uniref:Methyltransferase domain-containing protein n=1 Tax=Calocera viscosa (strain TUFC12733) TaxID=1330018 RepID=A0A167JI59_CALVF|nr:hypothetical protein CALVIDRAFT_539784 [Calocera viscosa TUFC12733]